MASLDQFDLEDLTILKLRGSLNADGMAQVEAAFREASARQGARIVVDLTAVDMLTTPAISMFIAAANAVRAGGGRLVFTESPPPVHDILRRLRLHSVLETVCGLQEAMDRVRR